MITQGAMIQFQGYLTRLDAKAVIVESTIKAMTSIDLFRLECGLSGLDVIEELEAGREWVSDCMMIDSEDAEDLTYGEIARFIRKNHCGGIKGWVEVSVAGKEV